MCWRSLIAAIGSARAVWLIAGSLALGGCGQEALKIRSVEFVDLDRGSGFFDRAIRICFDKPVRARYWHRVQFLARDGVRFEGKGWIRPQATAQDPRCQDKVLYMYIDKSSPPDSRTIIYDHIHAGNIAKLTISLYADRPEGQDKTRLLDRRIFTDL